MIKVGEQAPSFKLEGFHKGKMEWFDLKDYRGKWVILIFYPLDFTFVCPTEIKAFSKAADQFKELKTELFGISVDSVHSHKAWVKELGELAFPLLSDMKHEVVEAYNVEKADEGVALRGTFIIDPEGVLRYQVVSFNDVGRSVSETLRVLQANQSGGLCPIEWKPGEKFVGDKK
jgi:peroxiredoxin (alkyl hydroperoxide reductase subunit C)